MPETLPRYWRIGIVPEGFQPQEGLALKTLGDDFSFFVHPLIIVLMIKHWCWRQKSLFGQVLSSINRLDNVPRACYVYFFGRLIQRTQRVIHR